MHNLTPLPLLHGGQFTWDEFLITFLITFGLAGFVFALTRIRGGYDPEDDPDAPQPDA